jgi:hypothetical protein
MADLGNSKEYIGGVYPVHALSVSNLLKRCEPMLSPEQLISRFLKGVPLVFPNGDGFTGDELKDRINLAMNESELLLGRNIPREQFVEKASFDYALYRSYIHIKSEHGPIISLERLAIVSSDNVNIFEIPSQWVESSNFSKNQINVIPLLAAFGSATVGGTLIAPGTAGASGAGAGIAFLSILNGGAGGTQIPAYWEIRYTAGLTSTDGKFPVVVNELIGCVAAIALLSEIGATFIHTSQSQSQDGISQSSSGLGPRIYQLRIEELMAKRDELVKKLKGIFSNKFVISNI